MAPMPGSYNIRSDTFRVFLNQCQRQPNQWCVLSFLEDLVTVPHHLVDRTVTASPCTYRSTSHLSDTGSATKLEISYNVVSFLFFAKPSDAIGHYSWRCSGDPMGCQDLNLRRLQCKANALPPGLHSGATTGNDLPQKSPCLTLSCRRIHLH